MITHIGFGTAQVRWPSGRVDVRPGERLTLGLGVSATEPADLEGAAAYVWTNYGTGGSAEFRGVAMAPVPVGDGHQRAFAVELSPARPGTYVATAYVDVGGQRHWAQDHGGPGTRDGNPEWNLRNRLVFRVRHDVVDRLYIRQVPLDKVNARSDSTDISTVDDMIDGSSPGQAWYTLGRLRDEGVNAVWIQVPYRLDVWDRSHPEDTAGSEYASNDWFSIDPELSIEARQVPGWDLDRQREFANAAMRRFVEQAHELGMLVLTEIAPNHVGHNFIFRDLFGDPGASDVRRRDYSQAAVDEQQLGQVRERLASGDYDETVKNYAEYMLPQMYAAKWPDGSYNPFGASSVSETYSPDWYGLWEDTKHLNHGGHAGQRIWYPRTRQNYRVMDYIGRAMLWALTDLRVDGFRVDHTLGMTFHFFEQTLPWVEQQARAVRGEDFSMILVHEDHDRKAYSARVGDVVQSNGYHGLLEAFRWQRLEDVWAWYEFNHEEFVGTGNHDEARGSEVFGGDLLAYGNAVIAMQLLGGPMLMLAGDEFAEGQKLRFKAKGGIPTLWQARLGQLPQANLDLASWVGRGGTLRTRHPQLRGADRRRLRIVEGDPGLRILAFSRGAGQEAAAGPGAPLLVFANLEQSGWTSARFELGERCRAWLEAAPDDYYQIWDLMGFDPERPLWSRSRPGRQILDEGLDIGLQPYQIQALELSRVS